MEAPKIIKTDEAIFLVENYDNDKFLCNIAEAKKAINEGVCKSVKRMWNFNWQTIFKEQVLNIN